VGRAENATDVIFTPLGIRDTIPAANRIWSDKHVGREVGGIGVAASLRRSGIEKIS
jgi:hypothetical protein